MNDEAGFRLPFQSFRSAASFAAFLQSSRELLDLRYSYDIARAEASQAPVLVYGGTCGLCLRTTSFSTRMPDRDAAPGAQPNWREEALCGCPRRLNNRFRALLQFVHTEMELPSWARILLLGAAGPIEPYLRQYAAAVAVRARSGRLLRAPRFEPQTYHLIISSEHLQAEPMLDRVLAGFRDALVPGGRLVFTAPFDAASAVSRPPDAGTSGVLGWDILNRLTRAGFAMPAASLFWSEEFGHPGPFNLIFSAAA